MSAYIVNKKHIDALVSYFKKMDGYAFNEALRKPILSEDAPNEIGQILVDANYKSVNERYDSEDVPEKYEHELYKICTPVEILTACDGFEYQACEADDWESSSAFSIINGIRSVAIRKLPGYEEAAWEIRE